MAKSIDWSRFEAADEPASVDWSRFEPAEEPTGGFERAVRDTAVTALKTAVALPQGLVGLLDIPTGGRVGKFLENEGGVIGFRPGEAQRALEEMYSPETQAARRAVQEAEGFADTVKTALQNPSSIATGIGESIAPMLAGGLIGRGLLAAAAPRLGAGGTAAAGKGAQTAASRLSATGAAAAGEGALMAGQQASNIREQTADGHLTPGQSLLAAGTGVAGAGLSLLGARASNKLRIGDVDTMIVKGATDVAGQSAKRGLLSRVLLGGAVEGAEELSQSMVEQAAQNAALGRPLLEGVTEAGAQGLVIGAPFGMVGGAIGRPTATQRSDKPKAPTLDDQVGELERAVDTWLGMDEAPAETLATVTSAPSVDAAIAAAETVAGDTPALARKVGAALQPMVDRAAELTAQASTGLEADRQSALEQLRTGAEQRTTPREVRAEDFADLSPMDLRTARGRLAVLRDQVAREGGDSLSLAVVPHPNTPGRYAISRAGALPSLQVSTPTTQQASPFTDQRIETAAAEGDFASARQSFEAQLKQQGLTRALQAVERRGGEATQEEAALLDAAYPNERLYDRIQGQPAPAAAGGDSRLEAISAARAQIIAQRLGMEPATTVAKETPAIVLPETNRARDPNRLQRVQSSVEMTSTPVLQATTTPGAAAAAVDGVDANAPLERARPSDNAPTNTDGLTLAPVEGGIRQSAPREEAQAAPYRHEDSVEVDPATLASQEKTPEGRMSSQTHRTVKALGRLFGKKVVVFDSQRQDAPDGYVREGDRETIYLNVNSQQSHLVVFGHELLHQIRADNQKLYDAVRNVIRLRAGADTNVPGLEGDMEEVTADLVGNLFADPGFWTEVFGQLTQKEAIRLGDVIAQTVQRFLRALGGMRGFDTGNLVENLKDVRQAASAALAQYAREQRDAQRRGPRPQQPPGALRMSPQREEGADAQRPADVRGQQPGVVSQGRAAPRYGTARENALSPVTAWHFSQQSRPALSSSAYGTGLPGSGREQFLNAKDPRSRQRIYFYVDKGNGIHPESGVGGAAHEVVLNNVYDGDADPLRLKRGSDWQAFETALADAGFDGYLYRDHNLSAAVVLIGPRVVPAAYRGVGRDATRPGGGVRVDDSKAVQWTTQSGGPAEAMQAKAERMRGQASWADYDVRVTPASNGFAKVETRKKLPILNVGLSTAEVAGGGMIGSDAVRAALERMGVTVAELEEQQSDTETTAVVTVSRELTPDEGDALSRELQQEAIVLRRPDGTGELFGPKAAEWGPYNPEFFVMPGGERAAQPAIPVPEATEITMEDAGITENNASGESAASLEAQSRVRQERELDRQRVLWDRAAGIRPVTGVDGVDQRARAGQVLLQRGVGASEWTELDRGEGVGAADVARAVYDAGRGLKFSTKRKLERVDPMEISTRQPSALRGPIEDATANLLISDFAAGKAQPGWLESVNDLVTQYPNYRPSTGAASPERRLERLVRHMVDNLVWLHDQVPAEIRQRSKLWYDGANKIAKSMSRKYGITDAQAAGVLAALSPQKDWLMNVSLAERVAQTMAERGSFRWSPEMETTAQRIFRAARYQEPLVDVRGKTLSELDDDYLRAMWARIYDEAHNPRQFNIVGPEGDVLSVAMTAKGRPAKVAWGSLSAISAAVAIARDGSFSNISDNLGGNHKVRNFYNNILVPNSQNGHVTIDTHAVAAALLRPLSGSATEVMHNFGGPSSAQAGLQGTYALYEEAYRRAAEQRGLLPREMQSITWEAIRGMYRPSFKGRAANVGAVDRVWSQYQKGRLSHEAARNEALELAGGIDQPSWLGRDPGVYAEEGAADDARDVVGDGLPGRPADAVDGGAGGRGAGAVQEDLKASAKRDAEDALASLKLNILSEQELDEYNASRFDNGQMRPGVNTDQLGWEDFGGMLKRTFFVRDLSGNDVGVRRTAWYYPDGTDRSGGKPVLVLEDENEVEIEERVVSRVRATAAANEVRASSKRELADASEAVYEEIASDEEMIAALETYMVNGEAPEGRLAERLLSYLRRLPEVPPDSYLTFYRNQPKGATPWSRGWASWTTNRDQTRFFGGNNFEVLERKGAQGLSMARLGETRTRLTGEYHQYGSQGEWLLLNDSVLNARGPNTRQSAKRNNFGQIINPVWTMPGDDGKTGFVYKIQDKFVDLKEAMRQIAIAGVELGDEADPHTRETLYHGRTAKQTKDFADFELLPLMTEMRDAEVTIPEFEEFLHLRHAEERNVQIARINPSMPDGGSGIDTATARQRLAGIEPERRAVYDRLAARVDSIAKRTRDFLVASGLETRETIEAWEAAYKSYVPLNRAEYEAIEGNGTGLGMSVRGPASKRAMGSSKDVRNILANLARQREAAILRAEKNRVGLSIFAMFAKAPNPEIAVPVTPKFFERSEDQVVADLMRAGLQPEDALNIAREAKQRQIGPDGTVQWRVNAALRSRPEVLALRVNGQDNFVFFNPNDARAKRLVDTLKNQDMPRLGPILGLSAKVTRWFAAVNTQYNPVFGIYNFMRDSGSALVNLSSTPLAGKQGEVSGHVLPALRGIWSSLRSHRKGQRPTGTWADLWEDFQQQGGQTGFRDMFATPEDRQANIRALYDPASWTEEKWGRVLTIDGRLKAPAEVVVEKMGRPLFQVLSDYNEMLENAWRLAAYKTAIDGGMSKQQAANLAKNLTVNFNRKGEIATHAGALYAFFNAATQGTARLYETLKGPAGRRVIAGGLLLGAVQAAVLALAGFDDEEPPEWQRDRNLIVPIGDGKFLALPLPLGLHAIPATSRRLIEFAMGGFRDPHQKLLGLVEMYFDSFNPLGGGADLIETATPTPADPLIALARNRDWTGKPIAKEDFSSLDPTPGHTRARDSATPWATGLSEFLNWASGGTEFTPGMASPTPDQIDYLIGQVFGGVGREISKAAQKLSSAATGTELPSYKTPLVGRMWGDTKQAAVERSRYYDNLRLLNGHEREIKGRRESGRAGEVAEYLRNNPEARLVTTARSVERDIRALEKRRRELVERDASKETIRLVEQQIANRMRAFNERVAALEE